MMRRIALVVAVQLGCVLVAVAPQLSARATGAEYRLEVAPVDPVDPFRGAYVTLDYPGLAGGHDEYQGDVYVELERQGAVWRSAGHGRTRPDTGPYLACHDSGWQLRCGIESWFVPQDEAAQLEDALAERGAIAVVRIDDRGHAAIVGLEPR